MWDKVFVLWRRKCASVHKISTFVGWKAAWAQHG